LLESAGALWSHDLLDRARIENWQLPGNSNNIESLRENLERIVVAVDPAITANNISDDTGIVVAGIDVNGIGYILEDATGTYKPAEWAGKVGELFDKYQADRVVAERNQGGDMVRYTLETENPNLPLRLVAASKGKKARAEPVSALYEQDKVKHVKGLDELESQMVSWEPLSSTGSPDRIDACVWALTDLMLGGIVRPKISLSYQSNQDIKAQLG
jgi:phage terminase large subunit-like protein